jgi:NADH-quinone oxidoreductase subunit D
MSDPEQTNPAAPTEAPPEREVRDLLHTPLMRMQMGPSHPSTHGTVRMVLDLDGERVVRADVQVGYLHRGFEKECESGYYYQNIPYTDRLNYSSPMINNVGYCLAVEKLMDLQTPPRCQFIRVIASEISRMSDHFLCLGAMALELAAMTPFLYLLEARELMCDLLDALCGARVTTNYVRIGGVSADLPETFASFAAERLDRSLRLLEDADRLLTQNPVFRERVEGTGQLPADTLIGYSVTGPLLRAGGIAYDVRRVTPYLVYGELDFDVPVGDRSDNFDRYLVRLEEIRQSRRIIGQCLARIPGGPVNVDDPRVRWPRKGKVFGRMEEMIDQFKLVTEGGLIPPGEAYHAVEGANGELGFYIVSDGTGKPFKCRCRAPSFSNMSALEKMITGGMLADVIPTFDLINMIGGECDR